MKLFVIDTETTGTTNTDQICEIAGTLYQVGASSSETGAVASISTLLSITIANDAIEINGISADLTRTSQEISEQSLCLFKTMATASDYCVAFNAEFDAPRIDSLIGQQRWLCAMQDFDWGYTRVNAYGGYKLIDLALWMGIGISTAHRAADDVRLLVECMNRASNLQKMIDAAIVRSNSPTLELQALVSYADKDLAKSAGFRWDGTRKIWSKKVKKCDSVFLESLNFEAIVLSENDKSNFYEF